MAPAPQVTPTCCKRCCSQDMPVLQVGHQSAPNKSELALSDTAKITTRAAPATMSSVIFRVAAASAVTGTIKQAKTNRSLAKTVLSDGSKGNPIANACAKFKITMGRLTDNARNASFASSSCVRLRGLISQSWSTPGTGSW